MGQFKPMVKMETTEPTVELKLKRGGYVSMKKGGKAESGHKKMAGGGMGALSMMSDTPAFVGRPAVNAPVRAPGRPSMSMRRRAMMAKPAAMPSAPPMAMPPMKKGGKAEGGKMDESKDKSMIEKAFKQHDVQEHKGSKGTKLALKKGGNMATGGVALGNGGGFKKGGKTSKKVYAAGGTVNSGRSVAMPQGRKPAPSPVRISQLAGTYKNGGKVAPNDVPSDIKDQLQTQKNERAYRNWEKSQKEENEAMRNFIPDTARRLFEGAKGMFGMKEPAGSVTKTEKSVTVSPAGKRRGGVAC